MTLTASQVRDIRVPSAMDRIYNHVEATAHPRNKGSTIIVLVSLDEEIELRSGQTVELFVAYTDPNNKDARIGGANMVAPVSGTDYTARDAANGGGSLITSQFDLSDTEFEGSGCKIVATNNADKTGYLRGPGTSPGMQIRGKPLYRYSPVSQRGKGSTDSITDYGERWLRIDMPYQDNVLVAQDVANFTANVYDGILNTPTEVSPMTERPALLVSCLPVDIGSRIKVTEAQSRGGWRGGVHQRRPRSGAQQDGELGVDCGPG